MYIFTTAHKHIITNIHRDGLFTTIHLLLHSDGSHPLVHNAGILPTAMKAAGILTQRAFTEQIKGINLLRTILLRTILLRTILLRTILLLTILLRTIYYELFISNYLPRTIYFSQPNKRLPPQVLPWMFTFQLCYEIHNLGHSFLLFRYFCQNL